MNMGVPYLVKGKQVKTTEALLYRVRAECIKLLSVMCCTLVLQTAKANLLLQSGFWINVIISMNSGCFEPYFLLMIPYDP